MANKEPSKKQIIENYLLSEISKGNLRAGDQIPSEAELVEKFGFGRQTIHNCLKDLATRGIIERTPGKGSFVSKKPVDRNITIKKSFTDDMHSIGMTPGASLIEYKVISGKDCPVKDIIKANDNELLYYTVRIRTGNGIPIALQQSYTRCSFFKNGLDLNALSGSFDSYIAKQGIDVKGFVTKIKAVEATPEQMSLLGISEKALLRTVSTKYSDENTPIQTTITYYRSDLYEYTFSSF